MFPTPASEWITVEYDLQGSLRTFAVLEIVDATGRVVKTIRLHGNMNSIVVDLTSLQKGFYICKLINGKHTVSSKKFTKQ